MQYKAHRFAVLLTLCGLLATVFSIATVNTVDAHPQAIFKLTNSIRTEDTVLRMRISPDGTLIAALAPATITLRRTLDAAVVQTFTNAGMFAFSPNGQLLAAGGWTSDDHTIRIWNVSDGQLLQTLLLPDTFALDVAFTPDGQRLLAVSGTQIMAWNTNDWSLLWSVQGDDVATRTVVISPDGQTFATTNESALVKLWRMRDVRLLHTFANQSWGGDTLSYSPDSQFLATGGFDTNISIWKVSTGRLVKHINFNSGGVYSLAYQPSGDFLAVSLAEGPIQLLQTRGYNLKQTLTGHVSGVNSLIFKSDGRTLFSGGSDSVINVWSQAQ
jgi:WD40 repeat protein